MSRLRSSSRWSRNDIRPPAVDSSSSQSGSESEAAGLFAGLAGAIDLLGWEFHLDVTVVRGSQIGFIGIAVALLGRNSSIGILFSALLFGALMTGTTTRAVDPSVFRPELAGNLTRIIQGLVVLFVGADVIVLYLWQARRKLRGKAQR